MAAFTPRAVEQTQPTIERVVARLLDEVAELDEFDLVSQVAQRIPSEVMCEMLDFPLERREWAAERVLGMSRTLDPDISPAEVDALAIGLAEVEEYMLPVVAERRRDPADDLMSGLTQATVDGELLTDTEIIANIILLFLAGQSTTRSLISNAVVELFRHPDQMELLRSDPTLDRAAAEEFLRFVGTIQMLSKRALGPVTIDDVKFEEGDQAMIVLASANRDVKAYADPERMDLRRFAEGSQPPMASFGFGLHYCLGANLARMEVAAIVPPLVRSFPGLQMPDQVLTYPGFSNRGPNHVRLLTR
jgi:cytochrome P450